MKTQNTIIFLLVAMLVPILSFGQTEFRGRGNQTHTYKNNNGVTSTELEYRGKITFTENEQDVKYISPGGFLRFSKKSFGNRRTISLEGESNGEISREYREGNKKLPFEPDGRKWMASVLPEIIRTTGIGAEDRVARFYKKGGINSVIEEITKLPTNYVRGIYYAVAFTIAGISANDMVKLINSAGEEVSSSYELGKILVQNADVILKNEKTMATAIKVAGNINSSYEQAKVYKSYLKKSHLSEANKTVIIKAVDGIKSSYEQSGVLVALLKHDLSNENVNLILNQVVNINSSYEQSKVLQYLISNQSIDYLDLNKMIVAVTSISSSYEQSKVLQKLVAGKKLTPGQIKVVAGAARHISSDYEQSKFLQTLINEQVLDEESINAILTMTSELSSSYEKSKVLQLIIASDNFDNSNFSAIIKQASTINSSYDEAKVLSKIIAHDKMNEDHMLEIISAIDKINSSYEKYKLLYALAPQLPDNKGIRDAFMLVAKDLSDTDYGKIMRVMN